MLYFYTGNLYSKSKNSLIRCLIFCFKQNFKNSDNFIILLEDLNACNSSLFHVKSELIARFYSKEEIKTELCFTLMGFFGLFICFFKNKYFPSVLGGLKAWWLLSLLLLIINYIRKDFGILGVDWFSLFYFIKSDSSALWQNYSSCP